MQSEFSVFHTKNVDDRLQTAHQCNQECGDEYDRVGLVPIQHHSADSRNEIVYQWFHQLLEVVQLVHRKNTTEFHRVSYHQRVFGQKVELETWRFQFIVWPKQYAEIGTGFVVVL